MKLCGYDSQNYDHNCKKLALPCKYVGHIEDCPIIKKEEREAAQSPRE